VARSLEDLTPEQKAMVALLNQKAKEREAERICPGILAKTWDFAKNATRHATTGLKTVSDEERDRRLAICRGCKFYQPAKDRCLKCGCKGKMLRMKAGWQEQLCPLGLWKKPIETPAT